jgi:hypothetical protein
MTWLVVICALLGILGRTIVPYLEELKKDPNIKFDRKFLIPPLVSIIIALIGSPLVLLLQRDFAYYETFSKLAKSHISMNRSSPKSHSMHCAQNRLISQRDSMHLVLQRFRGESTELDKHWAEKVKSLVVMKTSL